MTRTQKFEAEKSDRGLRHHLYKKRSEARVEASDALCVDDCTRNRHWAAVSFQLHLRRHRVHRHRDATVDTASGSAGEDSAPAALLRPILWHCAIRRPSVARADVWHVWRVVRDGAGERGEQVVGRDDL